MQAIAVKTHSLSAFLLSMNMSSGYHMIWEGWPELVELVKFRKHVATFLFNSHSWLYQYDLTQSNLRKISVALESYPEEFGVSRGMG